MCVCVRVCVSLQISEASKTCSVTTHLFGVFFQVSILEAFELEGGVGVTTVFWVPGSEGNSEVACFVLRITRPVPDSHVEEMVGFQRPGPCVEQFSSYTSGVEKLQQMDCFYSTVLMMMIMMIVLKTIARTISITLIVKLLFCLFGFFFECVNGLT